MLVGFYPKSCSKHYKFKSKFDMHMIIVSWDIIQLQFLGNKYLIQNCTTQ